MQSDTDVFALPKEVTSFMQPARLAADAQKLADQAMIFADRYALVRDVTHDSMPQAVDHTGATYACYQPGRGPWAAAFAWLRHTDRFESVISSFHDEHRFSAELFYDEITERIYALLAYCSSVDELHEAAQQMVEAFDWEDFSYENSTDFLPEGVTAEEKTHRGEVWDRLLGYTRTPCLEIRVGHPTSLDITYPSIPEFIIGDAERSAVESVTLMTKVQRAAQLLSPEISRTIIRRRPEMEKLQNLGSLGMDTIDILRKAKADEHEVIDTLCEKIHALYIDDLLPSAGDDDDLLLSHSLTDLDLVTAAEKLTTDYWSTP